MFFHFCFLFKWRILRGKTKFIEFEPFQKKVRNVYIYFNEPEDIVLAENETSVTRAFVSSIDVNESPARNEFLMAMSRIKAGHADSLYRKHAKSFANLWDLGRIETDNEQIQTVIYSSYYYLLSSLPAPVHNGKLNQFYGLSPGSLSRGSYLQDYQGHSFWDTGRLIKHVFVYGWFILYILDTILKFYAFLEIWMFPSILMFYPNTAKQVLSYRISLGDAYVTNAKIFNTSGWR